MITILFQELIPYIEQRDDDLGGGTHVVIFTFGYEVSKMSGKTK